MPPNPIQTLDRLSVRSVLRGSTSTICGVAGTLLVVILCLAIYIPPANEYLKGDYYESELFHQGSVQSKLYSNRDFKIAIQFLSKTDNSVANHTDILNWAHSQFFELLADYSTSYYEPSWTCKPDYFADTINPVTLTDCFMFPEYSLLHLFKDWGYYTWYSNLFYWLYAKESIDPFTSFFANSIGGNYRNLDNLLNNYYYVVYFTSKIVDSKNGETKFQLNRFYSSQSTFNSNQGDSVDLLIYHQKEYNMDISIMPWVNNITEKGLVWLGKSQIIYQNSPTQSALIGLEIDWSFDQYHIASYRYYKKLDWLLGIIGGAMLLFYIILWVPCNYINRCKHKKDNVNHFLLLNHAHEGHRITQNQVTAANVSGWYYLSNPVVNCLSSEAKSASKLVMAGQLELDIVRLVKKMKVTERSLRKKAMWKDFKPKVLDMQTVVIEGAPRASQGRRNEEEMESNPDDRQSVDSQNMVEEQIIEEDFVDFPIDTTFGLTEAQMDAVKGQPLLVNVYQNNITGAILTQGENDNTSRLVEMDSKSRYKAKYETRRRVSKPRKFLNLIAKGVEYFDFFGAKPNLIVDPHGSSFVGLCGVILIITLSLLLVALTVRNANRPELMIDNSYQQIPEFSYNLVSGDSLKFALCLSRAPDLKGSARLADLRFFSESRSRGRVYYQPQQLSQASYEMFDIPSSEVPVNLNYCFTFPSNQEIIMGESKQSNGEYGYFGFRIDPYCSSTALYCSTNAAIINDNFLSIMNSTLTYLYLPQNRFDVNTTTLKNNMIFTYLNINLRYMKNTSAFEETLFVDEVRIRDNTQNWFMRTGATTKQRGISSNTNTMEPLSRSILGNPYYEVRIKPSSNQINYILSTKKADVIGGIIGGIFVLMYALFHWIGKLYNSFNVRAKLAEEIYYEESINESPINKFLTIVPAPTCLLPSCFHIRNDVMRMRQIEKKIKNDLNYVWLVRYVDTAFNLSSALFDRLQAKNLSLVFVKDKIDESEPVVNKLQTFDRLEDEDFIGFEDEPQDDKKMVKKSRKVINQTIIPEPSLEQINPMGDTTAFEKFQPSAQLIEEQNGATEKFHDNYMHGLPSQPRFNWLDTFEYPASLTLNGKREVTSCCGGCCCLILLIFICIIGAFQVSVYLDRDDARIGMSTAMMEPLQQNSNSTFNSRIHLTTGKNFKLAVTFSSAYADYPHNVSNWTNSAVGISIFKETYTRQFGQLVTQTVEVPLVPCAADYLTSWLSPLSDPAYFTNTQFGYCVPDGMVLEIDGLPQDTTAKRFTLSVYNKLKTAAGNAELKSFMQIYLPKYHVSNPLLDAKRHEFDYFMTSFTFDSFNVTYPTSQNVSLEKVAVLYDDQLVLEGDPYMDIAYAFTQFQARQTAYYDAYSNSDMSYNLSFANNYNVKYYTFQNQKFPATFGIIGGLIALFIFGFGCCARSFNTYRMHYLIGKQLYLFDMLKKKQARQKARGRLRKTREQRNELSDFNNMSQLQILKAYVLSLFATPLGFYNFNSTLRRVTLIQQRVEEDINLFNFYKKLHLMRDIFNQHFNYTKVPICDIYLKKLYNSSPDTTSLTNLSKLIAFAKKNNWSTMEQFAVFEAFQAKVNLKSVFDNAFLENALNMFNSDATSVHLSQFGGTQGTFGTNSMVSGNMSEMQREEEEIIPDEA